MNKVYTELYMPKVHAINLENTVDVFPNSNAKAHHLCVEHGASKFQHCHYPVIPFSVTFRDLLLHKSILYY